MSWRSPLLLPCWNAKWYKKILDADEFKELYVIKSGGWAEISMLSGKLSTVAENVINKHSSQFNNHKFQEKYNEVKNSLNGWLEKNHFKDIDSRLILLKNDNDRFTILEGNKSALSLYIEIILKKREEHNPIKVI